jgi:hypothetical protein
MKTHRFDAISFFSGLVFTALGLLFLLPRDSSDVWSVLGDIGGWFWPAVLLAIGFGILGSVLLPGRTAADEPQPDDDGKV